MTELVFKIMPRAEWDCAGETYSGSAHDRADGFLHFSTWDQLPETLRLYYAGQDGLVLLAIEAAALGDALKWEYSRSRGEDFPHLYSALPRKAVRWARPLVRDAKGAFVPPSI